MTDYVLNGGRMRDSMTQERFIENAQSMLLSFPDFPNGRWTRWVQGDDPIVLDNVSVDIRDATSVAQAIETTSLRGDAWKLECQRHAGNRVYPLRVAADATDGRRTWVVINLAGLPDNDSRALRAVLDEYLKVVVDVWNLMWFKAGTSDFQQAQKDLGWIHGQVVLGWETYISNEVPFDPAKLDESVSVTRYGSGRILRLAGTPSDPSLAAAKVVRRALGY